MGRTGIAFPQQEAHYFGHVQGVGKAVDRGGEVTEEVFTGVDAGSEGVDFHLDFTVYRVDVFGAYLEEAVNDVAGSGGRLEGLLFEEQTPAAFKHKLTATVYAGREGRLA